MSQDLTQEEYEEVKTDLEESFSRFSLPLKYLISTTEYEPKMMEDPKVVAKWSE